MSNKLNNLNVICQVLKELHRINREKELALKVNITNKSIKQLRVSDVTCELCDM